MNLKPCPFCGNTAITVLDANEINDIEVETEQWENNPYHAAVCDFSKSGCGATSGYRETPSEAAEAWNQRA
jgi:Lar family restriction alleviation protein